MVRLDHESQVKIIAKQKQSGIEASIMKYKMIECANNIRRAEKENKMISRLPK
jgi:hypothetical protein